MIAMAIVTAICAVVMLNVERDQDDDRTRPTAWENMPSWLGSRPSTDPAKASTYSRSEVRKVADALASSVPGKYNFQVPDIVTQESDGNVLADPKGMYSKDAYSYSEYELTNREGEHPSCVTIREGSNPGLRDIESAEVRSGRC